MTIPISFDDALAIYSKAKGAIFQGGLDELLEAARVEFTIDEFAAETVTALVVLGDKLLDAIMTLERLQETNDQLVVLIEEAQRRLAPPQMAVSGETASATWRGKPQDYWDNATVINKDIAQSFVEALRADSQARHPASQPEISTESDDQSDM